MGTLSVNVVKKWTTVLGSFLIMFPVGVPWCWGNISVYVLSYVAKRLPSDSDVEAPWVLPLFFLGGCVGLLLSGFMKQFLGKRLTVLFGTVAIGAGWSGAYFAVQKSLMALNVVIGLVVSLGPYIFEGTAMLYALEWCQDDMGIVSAIVQNGVTAGAICINQLATFYVNPGNMVPDREVGPSKFFTQDEVLDKVPSMFLMVAAVGLAFNITGLLLVRESPEAKKVREHDCRSDNSTNESKGEASHHIGGDESSVLTESRRTVSSQPQASATIDLSPKQILRTPTLYYYWFFFVVGEVSYVTACNYYKAYGQLYIMDDHFLTEISTALLLVITVFRILWGLMLDHYGLKATFVLFFSGCGITSLPVYFSPLIGKWCFAVAVLTFGLLASPLFVIFGYAAAKSFGKTYFLFNYGLIMIPTVIPSLALPFLLEYLLVNLGWFYILGFCSFCNLVGLVVVVFIWPNKTVT